ncbi:hypothetical protein I553_3035 [Mycobacterium xenopi 4042]|uniref:Uncharacterized protein n=1 Tax=Mycobacterium xenopi 4042 TaxID=1299334 RepID=X7ZMX5_MYCXE|nr:hypothetical protein I553_3035 [Mycobacterium xenopi 4042]
MHDVVLRTIPIRLRMVAYSRWMSWPSKVTSRPSAWCSRR